jgi:hypothetical protein
MTSGTCAACVNESRLNMDGVISVQQSADYPALGLLQAACMG